MSVTVHDKAKVIAENQRGKGDTGSPEVQMRSSPHASMVSPTTSRPTSRITTAPRTAAQRSRAVASSSTT